MKKAGLFVSFVLLLLAESVCLAQNGFVDGVELTTVKAPWTMRILGNDLDITDVKIKPDQASAYFMMASASSGLNVSVFIEPVDKCRSSEECRDHVLNLGNPAWGKFEQLAKGKIKDFSYFEFYRPEVQGKPLKMLDMYAQHVSNGYWLDLHVSKTLYTKQDHAIFEKVVNSISFVPKAGAAKTDFDKQISKAQEASNGWLKLWDSRKCRESYAALSSLSRAQISETAWLGYCIRMVQDGVETKSRNLIGAAFARSLPEKTDRPLSILAYYSNFENGRSGVELVALSLEKDGSWVITNYLIR
jgi:hypothetical protein